MIETFTAINLKTIPYSDSSLIVQVFSKEIGKVSLMAKGVKKSKTGNQGKLNTFSLNKYHVRKNDEKSLKTIIIIETIKTYDKIISDYNKLQAAYQIIWIINSIIQENQPAPELFELTETTLNTLENTDYTSIEQLLTSFKKELLIYEGVLNPSTKNINIELALESYIGKQMIKL